MISSISKNFNFKVPRAGQQYVGYELYGPVEINGRI